jgi:hypothetical protein
MLCPHASLLTLQAMAWYLNVGTSSGISIQHSTQPEALSPGFTVMTAKSELMQAHEAMAAVLDAKFSQVPEWKAFRAIDRALLALEAEQPIMTLNAPVHFFSRKKQELSYNSLTEMALKEMGKPITTPQLVAFIGARRKLDPDPKKAKINITSSLSKSSQFENVEWEGGTAWWYTGRPLPKKEAAAI